MFCAASNGPDQIGSGKAGKAGKIAARPVMGPLVEAGIGTDLIGKAVKEEIGAQGSVRISSEKIRPGWQGRRG